MEAKYNIKKEIGAFKDDVTKDIMNLINKITCGFREHTNKMLAEVEKIITKKE